jgi:hypothetical protein
VSKGPPWTPAEVDQLERLAGELPAKRAITVYRRWANREGFPARSAMAIEQAAYRHGLSLAATGEWLTVGGIAGLLGIAGDTPLGWIERGLLPAWRRRSLKAATRFYVARRDLVAFAKAHPELLGGIPEQRLVMAIEDDRLAAEIAATHRRRPAAARRVRAVEAGKVFPSVRAAARAMWVTKPAIQFALRKGGTCAGFHWEEVA